MIRYIIAACLLLTIPAASAEPPEGYDCVFGYNPDALTNVCYCTDFMGSDKCWSPTSPGDLCPVGNLCIPEVHEDIIYIWIDGRQAYPDPCGYLNC